jgi:hypothetical protein
MFSAEEQIDKPEMIELADTPAAAAEAVMQERANLAIMIKTVALDALDEPAEAVEAPRKLEAAAPLVVAEDDAIHPIAADDRGEAAVLTGSWASEGDGPSPAPIVIDDSMADPTPVVIEDGWHDEVFYTLPYPDDAWEGIEEGIAYPMPIVIEDGATDQDIIGSEDSIVYPMPVVVEDGAFDTMPIVIDDGMVDPAPVVIECGWHDEVFYTLPYPGDAWEGIEDGIAYPMPIVIEDGAADLEPIVIEDSFVYPMPAVIDGDLPSPSPIVIDDGLWFEAWLEDGIVIGCELTPPPEMVVCFPLEDMITI